MKLALKSTLAGAVLLVGGSAVLAQDIIIAPEQQTVIREYVVREQPDPTPLIDFDLKVGSILPDTYEVRRLEVPEVTTQYEYIYTDRGTVIVEPGTRRVIQVIE
jgi:hypothetical protein